jgi:predicted Zn-dependent protease
MTHYTDPRGYLYQPGLLDPDGAQRVTRDALKNCDDGELYLQYSATESFGFDDGRLKMADYSTGSGFGLRGVSGEMTGFSHANDMSEAAIRRQRRRARTTGIYIPTAIRSNSCRSPRRLPCASKSTPPPVRVTPAWRR